MICVDPRIKYPYEHICTTNCSVMRDRDAGDLWPLTSPYESLGDADPSSSERCWQRQWYIWHELVLVLQFILCITLDAIILKERDRTPERG